MRDFAKLLTSLIKKKRKYCRYLRAEVNAVASYRALGDERWSHEAKQEVNTTVGKYHR